MTGFEAIRARLAAAQAIAAEVEADRIHYDQLPQTDAIELPAIVIERVIETREPIHKSGSGRVEGIAQVNALAADAIAAEDLAALVIAELHGFAGEITSGNATIEVHQMFVSVERTDPDQPARSRPGEPRKRLADPHRIRYREQAPSFT
jgi:hypothetical protein